MTTSPARKNTPKQKIKIEVANVPSYMRVPKALAVNYDMLPDGYGDILIMAETLDEVMTDKVSDLRSRLPEIIGGKNFLNELKRFIPIEVQERTIAKEKFLTFLEMEVNEIFEALD